MKGEFLAQEIMPKFINVVNHTEGLAFSGGLILFRGRETSAGVIHGPIPIWGCTLHECASDGDI